MFGIVDRKNNDRIAENANGQLLVFLTAEEAQARYDLSGYGVYSQNDTTTQWEIAPVIILVEKKI